MKRSLLVLACLSVLLSSGFLVLEQLEARSVPDGIVEKQVNANLVRVRIKGEWQDVPLMPLADHMCSSGDDRFERYCD